MKPKEFWLQENGDNCFDRPPLDHEKRHGPFVHVIEYSAYEEAMEDIENLRDGSKMYWKQLQEVQKERDEVSKMYTDLCHEYAKLKFRMDGLEK